MNTEHGIDRIRKVLRNTRKTPEYQCERFVLEATDSLKELMEASSISKEELINRVGKHQAWLTNILHGDHKTSIASLSKAFWALGYRIIFDLEEIPGATYYTSEDEIHGQLRLF